jgi:hypothetical protein
MTTYAIDFADPLRTGFSIPQGGFNGPGGTLSNTTLRLYGRGAVEWGESVNENLVRIAENFAGATPPTVPLAGQLWLRQSLYVKNGANFFRWNVAGNVWDVLTVTTTAGTIGAFGAGISIGQYVYSTADAKLYRWDSAYKQATATWLERSMTVQGTNPTVQVPKQTLTVYDEYAEEWIVPPSSSVGDALPPAGAYTGELFYDTSTGTLYIWNSEDVQWQQILGPANTGGGNTETSGDLDMVSAYRVINMLDPVNPQDAATRSWTLSQINTLALNATGDTMTGTLTFSGANLDIANNRIQNITNTPTALTDAVNANYVNTQVSSAITALGISGSVVSLIPTPSGGDDGDISVDATSAWVRVNGTWRKFWPAQWV